MIFNQVAGGGSSGGGNYNIVQTIDGNNCSLAITDQNEFVLQNKTVTANGQYTADAQYSGLGTVTVNVPPTPTQSKNMVLGANAPATVNPDSGYDLSSVVPQIDTSVIKAENIAQGVRMLGITGRHRGEGSGIPSEYQEVQYIQSSGTQHIDTMFKPTNLTEFRVEFAIVSYPETYTTVFGARTNYKSYAYHLGASSENKYFSVQSYEVSSSSGWWRTLGTQYTVEFRNSLLFCDDVQIAALSPSSFSCAYNLYLFALNQGNNIIEHGAIKLYSLKITDDGRRIREFVPCYRKSDNAVGLYDLASQYFFENSGSGNFTAGPEVN